MPILLISAAFLFFTLFYLFFAGSVIYHLNAYTLPGWSLGRFGIIIFVALSVVLFALAGYFFFQIPWGAYA